MSKARTEINNENYLIALTTADEIEKMFPEFPGVLYIRFLAYKNTGKKSIAFDIANDIINIISEYKFASIAPNAISDVYKYAINERLSKDDREGAIKIAEMALIYWPNDLDFKNFDE